MSRLFILLSVAGALTGEGAVTSLTVFGDSLSDTGTIASILDLFGEPSVTPPPYYAGRFSNGPIYVERLGFDASPAFLAGGSNFAVGGALTSSHVGGPFLASLSLQGQIAGFRSQTRGVADPESLFILWIGGNDVRHAALGGDPAAGRNIIGDALEVVELSLFDLRTMGARRILVPNLPDFGRTPEFAGDPALATSLSEQWNAGLADIVTRQGSPDVTLFDANALFTRVLDDPAAYGIMNTTDQALLNPGADPDQFLYWDEIHPTARVHELIAREMRLVVPEPGFGVLMILAGMTISGWRSRSRP